MLTAEFTASASRACSRPSARVDPAIRFYQASSSEMFGKVREVPQTENTPFYPRSPYGVAKVYGHYITVNYRESYGLFAVSGILFNHESPRRGLEFVTRKITDGVARIKLGLTDELRARQPRRPARLGLRRRLRRGDVADAAAGRAGGLRGRHRRDALGARRSSTLAFAHVGLDHEPARRRSTRAFIRPAEVDLLVGDAVEGPRRARLGAATSPSRSSCEMMVDADLARLSTTTHV